MRIRITKLEDDVLKKDGEIDSLRTRMKQSRVNKIEEQLHEMHMKNQSLEQEAQSGSKKSVESQMAQYEERVNKYKVISS